MSTSNINTTLQHIERDTAREEFLQLTQSHKWCYYLLDEKKGGEFVPALVVENHPEYFPLDYTLGPSRLLAQGEVNRQNAHLNLSAEEVQRIILSSMTSGRGKWRRE